MSVSNGQKANQTTFNNAYLSKQTGGETTGVINLNNTSDPNSGAQVTNTQQAINELFDADGTNGVGDANRKNYSSNEWIADGDSRKLAIEKLDAQLKVTDDTANESLQEANDLRSLTGTNQGDTVLPSFGGSTIPDDSTIFDALQELETAVEDRILLTEKGAANGVATLDAGGKIPTSQIPASFTQFLGDWSASTNTPTLANGTGDQGDIYRVSVAGTVDFGAGSISFGVGDWVYYTGTIWDKTDNVDAVQSVNGFSGTVVLDTDDISEGSSNLYFTNSRADARADVRISASSIDALADVDTTTTPPTIGDNLEWDGTNWVPGPGGGGGSSAGLNGSVQFSDGAGGFLADPSNFVWDDASNHLGIGTATPATALHVVTPNQTPAQFFGGGSVQEVYIGRSPANDDAFVITHWPDDAIPYTDLHLYGTTDDHLTLSNNGNVGVNKKGALANLDIQSTAGQDALRLGGSTSGYVGFKVPAAAGSTSYQLPSADGTNGQVLSTDGAGNLSWSNSSGGFWVQDTAPDIYFDAGNVAIGHDTPAAALDVMRFGSADVILARREATNTSGAVMIKPNLSATETNIQGTVGDLSGFGSLALNQEGGNLFFGPAGHQWPTTDGANGEVLATNGTGVLSWIPTSSTSGVPVGSVITFAGAVAPVGWFLCHGQAISRTTFSDLFTTIGTTYGVGDGSTTFNLPDLRGRIAAGKDDMGGSAANRLTASTISGGATTLGNSGGSQTHALSLSEIPSHNHSQTTSIAAGATNSVGVGANSRATSVTDNLNSTGFSGGGGAHNNVQPTLILNYIIKT